MAEYVEFVSFVAMSVGADRRDHSGDGLGAWCGRRASRWSCVSGLSVREDAKTAARLSGSPGRSRLSARDGSIDRQYLALFEQSPQPMIAYERETSRIVAVSDAAVACYGYSREEFLAMAVTDLYLDDDLPVLEQFVDANLVGKRPGRTTALWRHRCKDGRMIDVEVVGNDLEFAGRRCRVLFCQDVTERNRATAELVQARERLHACEERYRLLFERNPQPMIVYELESLRIVAASNAMVASYGYSREELLTMTTADLHAPDEVDALLAVLVVTPDGVRPKTTGRGRRHRHKDGSIIEVDVTSDNLELDGRDYRIALFTDVTERNRATAELIEARELLRMKAEEHRLLFEHNPQPLLAYDCETLRFVAVSDAVIESTGYLREELLAMTVLDLAPAEDHAAMLEFTQANRG